MQMNQRLVTIVKAKAVVAAMLTTAALCTASQAATIYFEAESFVSEAGDGFDIDTDGAAFGGDYITTASDKTSDPPANRVTYNITADTAGNYDLYARLSVGDPSSDSMFIPDAIGAPPADWTSLNSLDKVEDADGNSRSTNRRVRSDGFFWVNLTSADASTFSVVGAARSPYSLSVGSNTLVIGGRETGLWIDAFVLSTDDSLDSAALNASIPEPASLALLGLGGLLIAGRPRRRSA